MPSFGFWELTLAMFVALLVLGPQRLPRVAAQAGAWLGKAKRLATEFKQDLSREIDAQELKNTIAAPMEELKEPMDELEKSASQFQRDIRSLDPLVKDIDENVSSGRFVDDSPDDRPRTRDEGD